MATNTPGNGTSDGYSSGEEYLPMDPVTLTQNRNQPSPTSPPIPIGRGSPSFSDNSRLKHHSPHVVTTATQQGGSPQLNRRGNVVGGASTGRNNHPLAQQTRSSPVPPQEDNEFVYEPYDLSSSLPASFAGKPPGSPGTKNKSTSGKKRRFWNIGNRRRKDRGSGDENSPTSPGPVLEPPPRPSPKPRTRRNVNRAMSESGSGNIVLTPDYDIDNQYGEMTGEEIAIQFGENLPLQLYVSKGTYGADESYSLSSDQRCNIHFIQHREVVRLEDTANNAEFAVPINSSLRFAPIFNHRDEQRGHLFPHVSDILAANPMPKMIYACQLCDSDGKNQRELLVVKEVLPAEGEDGLRKIRFYSITKKVEKILDENIYGHFTTRPSCMVLYLEELLTYIPDPFPMTVAIFHDTSRTHNISCGLPQHVFRRGLLLSKRYTDVSFVATMVLEGIEDIRNAQPFEIPTDIDVDFLIVKLTGSEKEQLRKDTEVLRKSLRADSVKHYRYANLTEELYKLQTTFYREVRRKEDKGISDDNDSHEYSNPVTTNRLQISHRVQMLETSVSRCHETLRTLQPSSYEELVLSNKELSDRVMDLERKLSEQATLFQTEMNGLREEMEALRSSNNDGSGAGNEMTSPMRKNRLSTSSIQQRVNPLSDIDDASARNKQLLSSMDQSQIQFLLGALGLTQYQDKFGEEGVCGAILVECDEDVLQHELEVMSRIHRIKLLALISGKTSVEKYL